MLMSSPCNLSYWHLLKVLYVLLFCTVRNNQHSYIDSGTISTCISMSHNPTNVPYRWICSLICRCHCTNWWILWTWSQSQLFKLWLLWKRVQAYRLPVLWKQLQCVWQCWSAVQGGGGYRYTLHCLFDCVELQNWVSSSYVQHIP